MEADIQYFVNKNLEQNEDKKEGVTLSLPNGLILNTHAILKKLTVKGAKLLMTKG